MNIPDFQFSDKGMRFFHCEKASCDKEVWAEDQGKLFCMEHFIMWITLKGVLKKMRNKGQSPHC